MLRVTISKRDKIKCCEPARHFRDFLSLTGTHPCSFAYLLSLTASITTTKLNRYERGHKEQKNLKILPLQKILLFAESSRTSKGCSLMLSAACAPKRSSRL